MLRTRLASAILLAAASLPALAGTVQWADWTGISGSTVNGAIGTNAVNYTGGFDFAQTNGGTNFWLPSTPYISATVSNAPSTSDIIALNNSGGTLTFTQPVKNPVMGIVSLGQTGVTTNWDFDADFTILSQGAGYWGGGAASLVQSGTSLLMGSEGHGTIQFMGTFTTITWSITDGEHWAGFSVGTLIPLPSAAGMSMAGIGVLALRRRRVG